MAFNSYTYHANAALREAWASIARAREIKNRAMAGEAYAWERADMESAVRVARLSMHQYLNWLRLREIDGAGKGKVGWA